MKKTKHTPGPWTAHDDDGTETLPCVLSDKVNAGGNFYVVQCNVFDDARLIAAAPDLLEAAKVLISSLVWERKRSGITYAGGEMLEAAIVKAEGRE